MKVLVIAPHMDDEVLGAGGTIAKHVSAGDSVAVCIAANRAYGHQYLSSDIEGEERSARQAQGILGYQELKFLRLPDEQLDRALIDLIVPLEKVVAEVKPDIVYTCHRGDVNQDHQAVFRATLVACRPLNHHRARRLLCYEVPSSTGQSAPFPDLQFAPNHYVELPENLIKRKVEALRCYGRESKTFPHPRSPEGILAYARMRGTEVNCEAAEAFWIVRDLWA
ncbi:MAG: PIG-L family deacetylase [Candidatus Omnitrophica bacterium]|nr:PIG-L family deacetylase [Candidatus Omnitrophota bacterium]